MLAPGVEPWSVHDQEWGRAVGVPVFVDWLGLRVSEMRWTKECQLVSVETKYVVTKSGGTCLTHAWVVVEWVGSLQPCQGSGKG